MDQKMNIPEKFGSLWKITEIGEEMNYIMPYQDVLIVQC